MTVINKRLLSDFFLLATPLKNISQYIKRYFKHCKEEIIHPVDNIMSGTYIKGIDNFCHFLRNSVNTHLGGSVAPHQMASAASIGCHHTRLHLKINNKPFIKLKDNKMFSLLGSACFLNLCIISTL